MKISILGSNGFLSNSIAKYFNNLNWILDVYGLDPPLEYLCNRFIKCNLMEADIDCTCLLDSDIIIYAVGAGIQSNLKESNNLIYGLNVVAPITICNKLKELSYKGIFVSFGSVFEMGETEEAHFFTEKEILTSNSPAPSDYIVSKRIFSRFASSYKHEYTHWHFIIPTIYGKSENPNRLIPYTINSIRNNIPLHFTAGDQTRQYIYVDEVPRLILLSYEKGLHSGVYNIQGKETMTVKEIVELIHSVLGKEMPLDCFGTVSRSDVGMKYLALDGSLLYNLVGFSAETSISDSIMQY